VRIEDITVEVRDEDLNRVGQLIGADLVGAQFILKYNSPGQWKVSLPNGSPMADLLRTPGYGLIVTGNNGVLMSGPTMSADLQQTEEDPFGTWVISGADDSVILSERLAYPDPATDVVTAQTASHDVVSGVAETVLKTYVDNNLVSGPLSRQVPGLTIATDLTRGGTVTGAARFDVMQELFYGLAQTGGLGYNIVQSGADLVFDVYEPVDRSAIIRLDVDNGKLSNADYAYAAPKLTRAIVAGAGEAVERLFYEGTTTDSTTAETTWNRRIERFIDKRGSEDPAELAQGADEALVDDGKTRVSLGVTPADTVNMVFGTDWGLGDTVTVVVNDIEATAVVYEAGIGIQADGVYIAATVGTPVPSGFEARLARQSNEHETRISNLERNTTGYGVNTVYTPEGGTDGTQPTSSGDFISGSYNRIGNLVHFNIQVDMDNITSFGTGQYYVTLPYPARVRYTFANAHLFDDSGSESYNLVGECAGGSDEIKLFYIGSNGRMDPFTYNSPVTLTSADYFDISGTYEIEG
jgi:hypothetical protein